MSTKTFSERRMVCIRRIFSMCWLMTTVFWAAGATAGPVDDLISAAGRGDAAAVQALLTQGAQVNGKSKDGTSALMAGCGGGHLKVVQVLLANGADVNAKRNDGTTALMIATLQPIRDSRELLAALLAKKADVNAKRFDGITALMQARRDLDAARLLLANRADVNAKMNDGTTALMRAVEADDVNLVQLLLANRADVNAKTNDGTTALMRASESGYLNVVQVLLAKGADVNAKENDGRTALFYASKEGNLKVIQWLIAKGAEINSNTTDDETALSVAKNAETKILLEQSLNDAKSNMKTTSVTAEHSLPDPLSDTYITVESIGKTMYRANFGGGQGITFPISTLGGHLFTNTGLTISFSQMFRAKKIKFYGDIEQFISTVGINSRGNDYDYSIEIVSAAAIADGIKLNSIDMVTINELGIVENSNLKSGWVNVPLITSIGTGLQKLKLDGVTFWVTDGGRRWLDFKFLRASIVEPLYPNSSLDLPSQWTEIRKSSAVVTMRAAADGRVRPIIQIDGIGEFEPVLKSLQEVVLAPVTPEH